jgi:hypothetical protein
MHIFQYLFVFTIIFSLGGKAQTEGNGKTIDITSSFKPTLLPPKKIIPTASPATNTATKTALKYDVPATLLSFKYAPTTLKPLAFSDTTRQQEDRGYVKAGFGNFSTPYVKAAINYGNGETVNGNLEGLFTSSKGKLAFQEFTKYGIKTNAILQVQENLSLQGRAGFSGQTLYQFGFRPDTLKPNRDSLRLNYNDIHLGASVGNSRANDFGVFFKADLDANFFSDNRNGNETSFAFDAPIQKEMSEQLTVEVGLRGLMSKVNMTDTSFANNLIMVQAVARLKLKENILLNAGLLPSWNNGNFNLLPIAVLEAYLPNSDVVFEAGITGGFVQNTWRSLVAFNPWIAQPNRITHSRNIEYSASVKGSLNKNWFFRIKAQVQKRFDVPLFINDSMDGRSFDIIWEPSMLITGGTGEITWQVGDKYLWNTQMTVRGFSQLKQASEAFGLLPFEIQSSFRGKIMEKLYGKIDFYHFGAPWRINNEKTDKGGGGLDMNLGAEFDIKKNLKLWLQFNNLFNDTYQRWNQYPVLGFQAIGGVIYKF